MIFHHTDLNTAVRNMQEGSRLHNKWCPYCDKITYIETEPKDAKKLAEWERGRDIQYVFPELSDDEREFLKTGLCSTCWDETFGDDDED
jgi:hypothetical protein